MSKATVVGVVVLVVVLAGGGALLASHKSSDGSLKKSTNTSTTTTSASQESNSSDKMHMDESSSSSSSTSSATNSVTIQNFAFSPNNITVKKGTAVTWTNQDSTAHTVTETDGQTGPKSGDLAKGQSYSFTFNTVGTFKYDCSIHPSMTGTVTVTE